MVHFLGERSISLAHGAAQQRMEGANIRAGYLRQQPERVRQATLRTQAFHQRRVRHLSHESGSKRDD